MKRKFYIPLKFKLTLVSVTIIALISAFLYFYFPAKFEQERIDSLKEKGKSIARIAAYGIGSGIDFDDRKVSLKEIENLLNNEEIRYVMVIMDDSIYYSHNRFVAFLSDYKNHDDRLASKNWQILKSNAPIIIAEKKLGEVYLGFSLKSVNAEILELKTSIGIVSIFVFLIGVFAINFMVKVFINPLSNIVNVVHKITDGDLSQRIDISSKDEVGFLAHSFNDMVEKIYLSNKEMDRIRTIQKENQQRKNAELAISRSLQEKEILLKEIHHRVKNNLQIVSSLFFFQSKNITDPVTLEMFRDGQNRVKSMALIHEKLYQSGDLANIDFREETTPHLGDLKEILGYPIKLKIIKQILISWIMNIFS